MSPQFNAGHSINFKGLIFVSDLDFAFQGLKFTCWASLHSDKYFIIHYIALSLLLLKLRKTGSVLIKHLKSNVYVTLNAIGSF